MIELIPSQIKQEVEDGGIWSEIRLHLMGDATAFPKPFRSCAQLWNLWFQLL